MAAAADTAAAMPDMSDASCTTQLSAGEFVEATVCCREGDVVRLRALLQDHALDQAMLDAWLPAATMYGRMEVLQFLGSKPQPLEAAAPNGTEPAAGTRLTPEEVTAAGQCCREKDADALRTLLAGRVITGKVFSQIHANVEPDIFQETPVHHVLDATPYARGQEAFWRTVTNLALDYNRCSDVLGNICVSHHYSITRKHEYKALYGLEEALQAPPSTPTLRRPVYTGNDAVYLGLAVRGHVSGLKETDPGASRVYCAAAVEAAAKGQCGVVAYLASAPFLVSFPDSPAEVGDKVRRIALNVAARHGHVHIVEHLLHTTTRRDVMAEDNVGDADEVMAYTDRHVFKDGYEQKCVFVFRGYTLPTEDLMRALSWAAWNGHEEAFLALLPACWRVLRRRSDATYRHAFAADGSVNSDEEELFSRCYWVRLCAANKVNMMRSIFRTMGIKDVQDAAPSTRATVTRSFRTALEDPTVPVDVVEAMMPLGVSYSDVFLSGGGWEMSYPALMRWKVAWGSYQPVEGMLCWRVIEDELKKRARELCHMRDSVVQAAGEQQSMYWSPQATEAYMNVLRVLDRQQAECQIPAHLEA